jgi:hypothetical protein
MVSRESLENLEGLLMAFKEKLGKTVNMDS